MGVILYFLALVTLVACGDIRVEHGTLTITGYNTCFISINGEGAKLTLNKTKYIHESFVVGLLKWKCDHEYGSKIVEVECKDCGIYCSYNQQFDKCKNSMTIPILSFTIAALITLISILLCMSCCKPTVHRIILKIVLYLITSNDRKRAKKVLQLNKITGSRNPILFRPIVTMSEELNEMLMESRLTIRKKVTGDEPIYEEICHKDYEANKFSRDLEMKIVNSKHHRLGESVAKAVVTGLALQSAIEPAYACDKTLYISSSGKVCDTISCTNINMYSIPIQTGSTVCFNTVQGEKIEMRMKDTKTVTRYHISYYSCDFKVTTKTTWECKSPGNNCWNGGTCHAGYIHPQLKQSVSYPNGYGCQSDTVGCDTWCWHGTSCVWYSWVMEPLIEKCYPVYHKVSEIWQTSIFIKYRGISKHIKLNTNNPRYNLNGFDILGLKDMPIIVTGVSHENIHLRNSIVLKGTRGYEVDASMTNFPIKNTIGEYQMSLDKQSFTGYTSDIKCQMTSCSGNCTYDEPAVRRLDESRYGVIPIGQLFRNGNDVLKRMISVSATANLIIDENVKIWSQIA